MFAGFVSTFQPEGFTGWGREGVNCPLRLGAWWAQFSNQNAGTRMQASSVECVCPVCTSETDHALTWCWQSPSYWRIKDWHTDAVCLHPSDSESNDPQTVGPARRREGGILSERRRFLLISMHISFSNRVINNWNNLPPNTVLSGILNSSKN